MRDLGASWPIMGREDLVTQIPELLLATSARAVVIGGVAGVGKSRLLNEVAAVATQQDVAVARVQASRSASSIPFGALAPLLPVDDLLADSIVGVLQRAAKAIASIGEGRRVIVAVDDAHLLDDASATLIHQLALDGAARILLTMRSGEHVGASLASVVNDPSTYTIDLHELRRTDVEALTHSVLGSEVDAPVVQALWDASRGNPLYLRELLVASAEDGSLREEAGVWRLSRKPTVPARLVELIESRLDSVEDDARSALEVLAIAGAIGRSSLEDLAGTRVVSELVQRGLVVVARDGRRQPVRLHHPLYEEALRRRMASRRLRSTQLQLADMVDATGMRRREDRLLVTTLKLDAGGQLDSEMIEAAALDAYFSLDIRLTERLTRAGVAAGAGPRLRRLLAEMMRWQGRHEEAEAIISTIPLGDVDERERTLTATVRAENLFRGLGEHDAAMRVLREVQPTLREAAWRDEVLAMEAVLTALSGDVRTGLAAAQSVLDRGPSRAMTIASTGAVAALTFMGQSLDAVSVAEEAFSVASAMGPQESQAVAATHVMERVLGLVESGRLAEAELIGGMSYEWALASGHTMGQGWFALLLARSAQTGGRLEEATRRFRESSLAFRDLRDHGIRRWALAGLAQAAATLGNVAEASVALDELDTAPATAVRLLEAEVLRARAWLAIAKGSLGEGRRLLDDAAEWARSRGQHGVELTMLHDLVRLGDTRAAATRAVQLGPEQQGPLAAARVAHAEAALRQDAALLDGASDAFAGFGANLYAAEASAQAAAAHRRAGRMASAAASAARSAELAARCDGASTPALTADDTERLTARELELATLAAAGKTSAEIAAELEISVRTVNNLLQRAYVKLGVSGRRELADRLDQR